MNLRDEEEDDPIAPPGDDVLPVPPPVDEQPVEGLFCDLVLTGGVASGVVYPWAIVEIARTYSFRSIGGTSVGAMAAALAAAAEYGRRHGHPTAFEPLRRAPGALAEELPDGRTRMFSLFQPGPHGKRLMRLWGALGGGSATQKQSVWVILRKVTSAYRRPCALGALVGFLLAVGSPCHVWLLLGLAGAAAGLVIAFWRDLRDGVITNNLGLCKGGTLESPGPEGERPGLSEWLHNAIQASAGLKKTDRPLTFRDLWCAPAYPGAPRQRCDESAPASQRSIDLQVITTNVTHGRPYRLPLTEDINRLFFRREELQDYFPPAVLDALVTASQPYVPRPNSNSDPAIDRAPPGLRMLPGIDLPVVVAARLSLSFPLLFSAVPLWAIDYEPDPGQRDFKPCQFTDGGASSNFPVHLFDAAVPTRPTFGLWLDRRNPYRPHQAVWLPAYHFQGWGDSWHRFDPEAAGPEPTMYSRRSLRYLVGFLVGTATSAVDWRDRASFRQPHVRNRVARLLLRPGEGGLNIAMPRAQILEMAHHYGTRAGRLFVRRFASQHGRPSKAWREQRWVRMELLIKGLCERLTGLASSAAWARHAVPMADAIREATRTGPIEDRDTSNLLNEQQADALAEVLRELERLEGVLRKADTGPYRPVPESELRLRAPL